VRWALVREKPNGRLVVSLTTLRDELLDDWRNLSMLSEAASVREVSSAELGRDLVIIGGIPEPPA